MHSPNVKVQTAILYLLNHKKPFINSRGFFHKIGFKEYKNKKNKEMNKDKIFKFFVRNCNKLIFLISRIMKRLIKYWINIKAPTNLILTKKEVKKDNKIIFLISNFSFIK